jgi:hypothetical protein
MSSCRDFEVAGAKCRGTSKKTWSMYARPAFIGSETGVDIGHSGVEVFDWGNRPTRESMEKGH